MPLLKNIVGYLLLVPQAVKLVIDLVLFPDDAQQAWRKIMSYEIFDFAEWPSILFVVGLFLLIISWFGWWPHKRGGTSVVSDEDGPLKPNGGPEDNSIADGSDNAIIGGKRNTIRGGDRNKIGRE